MAKNFFAISLQLPDGKEKTDGIEMICHVPFVYRLLTYGKYPKGRRQRGASSLPCAHRWQRKLRQTAKASTQFFFFCIDSTNALSLSTLPQIKLRQTAKAVFQRYLASRRTSSRPVPARVPSAAAAAAPPRLRTAAAPSLRAAAAAPPARRRPARPCPVPAELASSLPRPVCAQVSFGLSSQ